MERQATDGARSSELEPSDTFERYMRQAHDYQLQAQWELAWKHLDHAEIALRGAGTLHATQRQVRVDIERGGIERRQGRYGHANSLLETALDRVPAQSIERAKILGELGVVYFHQSELKMAKATFTEQYDLAKTLLHDATQHWTQEGMIAAEAQACRAVGNLGLAVYQEAVPNFQDQTSVDQNGLHIAITHCNERVKAAKALQSKLHDNHPVYRSAKTWESIGLDRLTLCYAALGETGEAIRCGESSQQITENSPDPTVRALSRFYYGYALARHGSLSLAKERWEYSGTHDRCTSAIALCKEPSAENQRYLREVIKHGVRIDHYDEQGYSALDYAVLARDTKMQAIVKNGLRNEFADQGLDEEEVENLIEARRDEAERRWRYRELFQKHFRPALTQATANPIPQLRRIYSDLLTSESDEMRATFDSFRFVKYTDFRTRLGSVGLPQPKVQKDMKRLRNMLHEYEDFIEDESLDVPEPYVVFMSYRWIGREHDIDGPDDAEKTQYFRILHAVELFFEEHPELDEDQIFLWLDVACIDQINQDYYRRQRGINAIPLNLAQCDAMISLVDDKYFNRPWCAVEVLMMQTLRNSYGREGMYECWDHCRSGDGPGELRRSRDIPAIDDDLTGLSEPTNPEDKPTIRFLVRQSKILGNA